MKLGVVLPQNAEMVEPETVRQFVRSVEEMGFNHLITADHVLGVDPSDRPPGWPTSSVYTHKTFVHEPLVLFAFLSSVVSRLEFAIEVVVLPQRQTALFAKQAAALDYLAQGRLRVGVGVGWNSPEFDALNEDFSTRGQRIDEQVALLRSLWTEEVVSFQGRWHQVDRAGVNPLPVQRPIPIWMGGHVEPVLKRAAALADGWMPQLDPRTEATRQSVGRFKQLVQEAGRDISEIGIEARLELADSTPEDWRTELSAWKDLGATHVGVTTRGLRTFDDHLTALRQLLKVSEDLS